MFKLKESNKFRKDLKRIFKQNKDISKLKEIIELLVKGINLPFQNKDHFLKGSWKGHRECHIEPNWLLIYKLDTSENTLYLVRTGSHSDLFD